MVAQTPKIEAIAITAWIYRLFRVDRRRSSRPSILQLRLSKTVLSSWSCIEAGYNRSDLKSDGVEKREPEAASGKLIDVVVLPLVFKEAPEERKHPRLLVGVEGVHDGAGITEAKGCT